jgi:hypothetical protein
MGFAASRNKVHSTGRNMEAIAGTYISNRQEPLREDRQSMATLRASIATVAISSAPCEPLETVPTHTQPSGRSMNINNPESRKYHSLNIPRPTPLEQQTPSRRTSVLLEPKPERRSHEPREYSVRSVAPESRKYPPTHTTRSTWSCCWSAHLAAAAKGTGCSYSICQR